MSLQFCIYFLTQFDFIMVNLEEIQIKIRAGEFKTRSKFSDGRASKRFKSPIWKCCNEITDQNDQLVKEAIYCVRCSRVFKYNPRSNGTTQILNHGCLSDKSAQTKIDGFTTTKKVISEADKNQLKMSSVSLCTKDFRPFEAISGIGLFTLIKTCIFLGAKYGNLEDSQIRSLLPSSHTISRTISQLASQVNNLLFVKVADITKRFGISLTTDVWTDNFRRISYLALTVHFSDFLSESSQNLRDQILCLIPLSVYEKKPVHIWLM